VVLGREGVVHAGRFVVVVPGIDPAAERLTRLGGVRSLVLVREAN
jgi:hypothetical protein